MTNDPHNDKLKDQLEKLRRYETTRREQLGAALSMILGLAAAAVGFCVSRIADKDSHFSAPGTYFFLGATLTFIITVGICMLTTWTRLLDFRVTTVILRREMKDMEKKKWGENYEELDDEGENPEEKGKTLKELRDTAHKLGKRTWCLFRVQTLFLGTGVVLLSVSLWILYCDRLFPTQPTRSVEAKRG